MILLSRGRQIQAPNPFSLSQFESQQQRKSSVPIFFLCPAVVSVCRRSGRPHPCAASSPPRRRAHSSSAVGSGEIRRCRRGPLAPPVAEPPSSLSAPSASVPAVRAVHAHSRAVAPPSSPSPARPSACPQQPPSGFLHCTARRSSSCSGSAPSPVARPTFVPCRFHASGIGFILYTAGRQGLLPSLPSQLLQCGQGRCVRLCCSAHLLLTPAAICLLLLVSTAISSHLRLSHISAIFI